ncbi:MAG: DUF11 domain-containing protein [Candidatus Methanoperedens sp.]|nr:DUF11 domain-containing protein [Candidatus Methanoperedens sp.]
MRRFAVPILIFYLAGMASGATFSPNDIEWAAGVSADLGKGGTLTNGDYMVKAVEFPAPVQGLKNFNGDWVPETEVEPMVYIEIYRKGVLLREFVLTPQTEPYIDPDYEVKVSGKSFMSRTAKEWILQFYNPTAGVSIQTRAKPKLEVTISTDKGAYTSYTDKAMTATVTVKNTGEAFLKNVDVRLDIGELKLRGGSIDQLHQFYYRMDKGTSQSFDVILVVPELLDQKSYKLSAQAKGYEVKDAEYSASAVLDTLTVSPKQNYFTISKAIKDNMYLQNAATVRITIGNGGTYDIRDIYINDSINENFELTANASFNHYIPVLKPGGDWGTTYSIRALSASLTGFSIPVATARFTVNNKQYSISSAATTVVVNGPKIILNKTVDKPTVNISEDVTVTVTIKNEGNIGTKFEARDELPESVSLVSGITSLTNMSEPNTVQGFSYIIRMNKDGEIQLPPVVTNYTGVEYRGMTKARISSGMPVINVTDPSKIPPATIDPAADPGSASQATAPAQTADTPVPASTQVTPGFGIIVAIMVLTVAAIHRRK